MVVVSVFPEIVGATVHGVQVIPVNEYETK